MVLLGLGSNQGESTQIMVEAINALTVFAIPGSLRSSRLWRTTPVDCPPDSADFINSAATFEAIDGLSPEQLLKELKQLERAFGRGTKHVRNAPRELDLDLLLFGDQVRNLPNFVLPHPRAPESVVRAATGGGAGARCDLARNWENHTTALGRFADR